MTAIDHIGQIRRALAAPGGASSDYDLNPAVVLPEGRKLRPAAVLCAVQEGPGGLELILTKRSSRLKHHPGQIAFPGGKIDEGDDGPIAAALREADEEIGLPPDTVDILGTLPGHETVTGFIVTPVIGVVTRPFQAMPEAGEVEEAFRVPFGHVTDPAKFVVQWRYWQRKRRYYFTVPYGPYYIWGATACILRGLAGRMDVK